MSAASPIHSANTAGAVGHRLHDATRSGRVKRQSSFPGRWARVLRSIDVKSLSHDRAGFRPGPLDLAVARRGRSNRRIEANRIGRHRPCERPTSAQRSHNNEWAGAVDEINAILGVSRFRALRPVVGSATSVGGQVIALVRPVHGPEAALVAGSSDELRRGLDASPYELEPSDLFQTFMVFYLTSADGQEARAVAPRFSMVLETWLAHNHHELFARLQRMRGVCVGHRAR
jgi:hypothetical protein